MPGTEFNPIYSNSYALVIGINNHKFASPLKYAVNDAEELANTLKDKFRFPEENITLLIDKEATRANIHSKFLSFSSTSIKPDDRILVFFAGHGNTQSSRRGEVGFLVPYDGNTETLSSLIRWDELTRNAALINAKHIFFIMDACYGGLAITRGLPPGSMRFLKDMLLRYSRQVLTAGKANEEVYDSGGPLANHSVFTGHLLEALNGKAATDDGIITANGVMAYTYERVSKDLYSEQTPHYGFIEGDGDFIFNPPDISVLTKSDTKDEDVLISIPPLLQEVSKEEKSDIASISKKLISDPKETIHLHDLCMEKIRKISILTSEKKFPAQGVNFSPEELIKRLATYESIVSELQVIVSCIAYWGTDTHYGILQKVFARMSDPIKARAGLDIWSAIQWHPIIVLFYSAGIAALEGGKLGNLCLIFYSKVKSPFHNNSNIEFVSSIGRGILDLARGEAFKKLSGHERFYAPRSEYLFKLLQPFLDDLLFLGKDYEHLFDKFEVLLALSFAQLRRRDGKNIWGPIGRFGWKYHARRRDNPLEEFLIEARLQERNWSLIKAGFFEKNYASFLKAAGEYVELIKGLEWC